ncbi:MAG: glycosyltransferase [Clostridiales bacterium]|nr:glycosyltransferase [Clostridiales bacterium]
MKKLLFTAYTLDVGGIETALVALLNNLIDKYDITLVLEKKQGVFLDEINKKIKIIQYNPNQNKNPLIRKTINLFKRINFIIKYKNKFDFAASFATYSKMGSFCARTASKNNALWIHSNYLEFYDNKIDEMTKFFEFIEYNKFNKFIFVSQNAKNAFNSVFKNTKERSLVIHNLLNHENILKKSKENIILKKENIVTFLNVARHDEKSKKITRLINAAENLKIKNYEFKILLVGNGKDTNMYQELVSKKDLEKHVFFLGEKTNPYPYFLISDCIILTSEFEGYPVVFDEAFVLQKPIITTNVSDALIDIENKQGFVTDKDVNSIVSAMEKFIKEGYFINKENNPQEVNNNILNQLNHIFIGGDNA